MFQEPRHTPVALSVVRTIWTSVSQVKKRCFRCGQSGHRLRDCLYRQGQGGSNGRSQSTTSVAPASRLTQQGNLSGTGGGQCQNMLYALRARQDQEASLDVVTSMLRVCDLDVYALFDPWATLLCNSLHRSPV